VEHRGRSRFTHRATTSYYFCLFVRVREHRHADRDREREMFHAVRDDVHDVHDDPFVIKRVVVLFLFT